MSGRCEGGAYRATVSTSYDGAERGPCVTIEIGWEWIELDRRGVEELQALLARAAAEEARAIWDGARGAAEAREEMLKKVFLAAKALRDSGYDGPFLGDACVDLFRAIREAEAAEAAWEVERVAERDAAEKEKEKP